MDNTAIGWTRTEFDGCAVVRPAGTLNSLTYRRFRDDLVKFAVDAPRAVIVPIDALTIGDDPALTAFSGAWLRVSTWPAVPILVVAASADQRARLRAGAVDRFVPVLHTVRSAADSLTEQPQRRRATLDLALTAASGRRARRFVEDICRQWTTPATVGADARLIATELVENALIHADTDADIELRLELRRGMLTVAVSDSDPRPAVLREPGHGRPGGLHVLAHIARAWGCTPRRPRGKVVWATITCPHHATGAPSAPPRGNT
ncbi:hypothetical protein BJY24_004232 [Nocardia transvalensis]|uniref:Histidine kinase/HSP90-like ATPase domain-containing protein n=1 Tax=Nocardia transvalensis TaxID=37333 RepID=A0A7W9PFV6_9NOCA|nr:ATP-binding protein [Nocardia transvalensis]MBB5915320.1 hypothetical protein [Nocardia transvalensis]